MVTITYERASGLAPTRLEIKGHALYGEPGQDVLCSALSILMHTAAKTVEEMQEKGWLMEDPTLELSVGQGVVELIPSPKYSVLATEKMDTVVTGLRLLEAYYPKYVKMAKAEAFAVAVKSEK